ncbi:TKL protein kinase [Saprolegnia diclina VS20]|uniref:TKL protein kinase n=1 Tax=Saprolegnia diclina (strain VS20) TaxID=1156394 RepID=T0PRC3_SAPDV|nr:TKL protein kinase [Saprolegnia diclina VS20]EQC24766.1 TKL protein kinase [Saprolegnia diclina VS20]|eukprot:XP_008621805.1 TKL protein kinase [Saprolegnia diclina VS20]
MSANAWLENADLVTKYQALSGLNTSTIGVSATPTKPDAAITVRLNKVNLTWDDLPPLAKLAILWDMGFVPSNPTVDVNALSRIYTRCVGSVGESMASIALPKTDFLASQSDATTRPCNSATSGVYLRQENSNGGRLRPYTRCATANITMGNIKDSHSSMWAQDGQGLGAAPYPNLQRHAWNDKEFWLIFAIHTQELVSEPQWGTCPDKTTPAGATFPCQVFDGSVPPTGWCVPSNSQAMDAWLKTIATQKANATPRPSTSAPTAASTMASASSFPIAAIIGIAIGGGLLLGLGVWWCLSRRRKHSETDVHTDYIEMESRAPRYSMTNSTQPTQTRTGSYQPITTASHTLNEFQRDQELIKKRVPYSAVVYSRLLSKGAFGEVWLGSFNGQVVAIKRLLDSKRTSEAEIEGFADEIRLMASFTHPNIVRLIGFAWNSLQNLCAVTEYMANGDLYGYLHSHQQLQWQRDEKIKIALGIAHALAYLHSLSPKIIHRDLKSKNVLIGDDGEAELSDFGISRKRTQDETMTAGVGTIFWTAPEVLLGEHYSEMADIYSFGVVLCEMDTHASPLAEYKGLPQATMIHRITNEGLRPSLLPTCPEHVQSLAARCMARDPKDRPSAHEVVAIVQRWSE